MQATKTLRRLLAPALVDQWLDQAESDRRVSVLACGASGMGKSHLASALIDAARRRGFDAVLAGPSPAGVPFQVLTQLGAESTSRAPLESAHLFWLARSALAQRAGAAGRVALVFEDVDAYDVSDLAFVRDLVASTTPRGVVTLVTSRCAELDPPATAVTPRPHVERFLQALPQLPDCERWDLEPLTLREATDLILGRLHQFVAPRAIRGLLELAEGNPRYLGHLVDGVTVLPEEQRNAVLTGSRSAHRLGLPAALRQLVHIDASRLSRGEFAVLEALAIWAMPADVAQLSDLSSLPPDDVVGALESLERSALVTPAAEHPTLSFVIPSRLVSRSLVGEAPALRRRIVHQRASELLDPPPPDLTTDQELVVAEHYLGCGVPPSDPRAAIVTSVAAQLARRSRYDDALALLAELLRQLEAASRPVPPESAILLAEARSRGGVGSRAARALRAVANDPSDPADRTAAQLQEARAHVERGDDERASAVYRLLLPNARVTPSVHSQVLQDLGLIQRRLGKPSEAIHSFGQAAAVAGENGMPSLAANAHLNVGLTLVDSARPTDGLRHIWRSYLIARREGEQSAVARAVSGVGGGALAVGDSVVRATAWLRRATRLAERSEDYVAVSWSGERLAGAYIETGEWDQARSVIGAMIEIDRGLHQGRSLRRVLALERMLNAYEGGPASSDPDATVAPENESLGGPAIYVVDLAARFEHLMLQGRADAAAEAIELARRLLRDTPGWERLLALEVLPRRAAAAAALGDERDLQAIVAELGQLRDQVGAQLPLVEAEFEQAGARLAILDRRFHEAAQLAAAAAATFSRYDYRWRRALAVTEAGRADLLASAQPQAIAHLEDAYRSFQLFGARKHMSATRELLHELGRRVPTAYRASSPLTPRQWEVVELLSERLSDAAIAERLQISRRTVTTHVHNILRTLDLHSRIDVKRWYDERAARPTPAPSEWVAPRPTSRRAG